MNFSIGTNNIVINKIDVAKKILSYGVTYGVGIIVYSAIKNNLPADLKLHKKIAVALGSWALGSIIQNAAEAHTNKFIDDCVKSVDDIKKVVSEMQQKIAEEEKSDKENE